MTVNMQFKQVGPFIQKLGEFAQTNTSKLPVKDLKNLLKENIDLVNDRALSSDQVKNLYNSLEGLKTRFSKDFSGKDANKVLKAIGEYHLFEGIEKASDLLSILKQIGSEFHHLDLSNRKDISDDIVKKIPVYCPNLESFTLHYAEINTKSLQGLSQLKYLKSLELNYSDLNDDDLNQTISNISTLQHLNLSRCYDFTEEGFGHLTKLTALKTLIIPDENVTQKACLALMKILPELHITLED